MKKLSKKPIYIFVGMSAVLITVFVYAYQLFFTPNILVEKEDAVLYIPENASIQNVSDSLRKHEYLEELIPFMFVSKLMKYHENVKSGRYLLRKNMTNVEVVRLLRSGTQEAVKVTFSHARTLEDLAPIITKNLACTSDEFLKEIHGDAMLQTLGFDTATVKSMFIPNTYEMYWNSDAKDLLHRMKYEYTKYWTKKRLDKAERLGLSQLQVSVLASIVQAETIKGDEKPKVAGLYMNRLNRNMLLQSDPTVVYAVQDFTIKRVLNKHLEVDSPYNTYKYSGLPPAPINVPSIQSLDAVLNMEKHKYLYMCAKEDFSGYHNFAKSLSEHNRNAARYQRALNKKRIYK